MATNRKRLEIRAEKLRGWIRLDQKTPLLYRKEVIYSGDWKKLDSSGEGIAFAVAHNTLNHWKESLTALRAAGIKSPLTKSHEQWDQPENRLGEVTNAVVSENDKGLPSLYLDILFDDEKSRDIGLKGDVSIGSPPDVWYDGTGKAWTYPLQHVASTNTPVIPGLETWQKIAAAFGASNKSKGSKMDLDALIKLLGIKVPDGAGDDVKSALCEQAIQKLVEDEAGEGDAAGGAPPVPADTNMSHDHPMVELYRDSGGDRVQALVEGEIITPAVAKFINLSFCDPKDIAFELSHDRGGSQLKKVIELVKMVAKDRPLKASGRTDAVDDARAIELSHASASNGGLAKNAEKRAELAKAAAGRR